MVPAIIIHLPINRWYIFLVFNTRVHRHQHPPHVCVCAPIESSLPRRRCVVRCHRLSKKASKSAGPFNRSPFLSLTIGCNQSFCVLPSSLPHPSNVTLTFCARHLSLIFLIMAQDSQISLELQTQSQYSSSWKNRSVFSKRKQKKKKEL